MLAQRLITAVILLAVLLAALLATSPWPLVILLALAAACALWEWLRLTWPEQGVPVPAIVAVGLAILIGVLLWRVTDFPGYRPGDVVPGLTNQWLILVVAVLWVIGATALVVQGKVDGRSQGLALSIFAVLAVWAAWAALVQMFLAHGAWFLVSLLALVWCADIAAYFTGRAFGRRKLAPRVSPGKTWEGAMGGMVAAVVWVAISTGWEGSFGQALLDRWSWFGLILVTIALAALSIIGDLFESLLKRRAGVKDSSHLLPGHGGVYDRIDALLPVAPLALLLTGTGAP